jgi:hypothetical protein
MNRGKRMNRRKKEDGKRTIPIVHRDIRHIASWSSHEEVGSTGRSFIDRVEFRVEGPAWC